MSLKKYVLPAACVAALGVACFCPEVASAADFTAQEITKIDDIINVTNLKQTLLNFVGPIVAAAIGIGLAVWGARFLFRIVKSMARG